MNQYSSGWRKLQFYESLLFEVEGTPILRVANAPVTKCFGGGTELIPRREGVGAGSLASNLHRTSSTVQMEETSILRVTLRDRGSPHSAKHSSRWKRFQFYESLLFGMEENLFLRATPRDGGNSHSTNHSSRWRKTPFYESLFEMEETPILRVTLRGGESSNSTHRYCSTGRNSTSTTHCRRCEKLLLRVTLRERRNYHSTNHTSRCETLPCYQSLLKLAQSRSKNHLYKPYSPPKDMSGNSKVRYCSKCERLPPVLRIITLRHVRNYHFTNHYFSN